MMMAIMTKVEKYDINSYWRVVVGRMSVVDCVLGSERMFEHLYRQTCREIQAHENAASRKPRNRHTSTEWQLSWGPVRLCARPSHSAALSKRRKLRPWNFYWGLPWESSLSWQNFVPVGAGVPLEWGRQRGVPALKRRYFAVIGS